MLTAMRNAAFAAITGLVLLCSSAGSLAAADQLPARPSDGILDDTRAFTEAEHAQLAAQMRDTARALNCEIWLMAGTFLISGDNLRSYSRELRRSWSGEGDALLLAYERASDKQFLSFSPALWERYPSADLVTLMHRNATILAEKERPIGARLSEIMKETLTRLTTLEKQRQRMQQPLPGDHLRLAKFYGGGIGAAMLVLLVTCGILRRRETAARYQLNFPNVQVATRFGAPFGSQITGADPGRKGAV
jgi:hypothetical protein